MGVKLKNILILGSFFSVGLLSVLLYYLHERVVFLESQERVLEINFNMEKKHERYEGNHGELEKEHSQ